MTTMTRAIKLLLCLFSSILLKTAKTKAQCNNSDFELVEFRKGLVGIAFGTTRTCKWVGENPSSCQLTNIRLSKRSKICEKCARQCLPECKVKRAPENLVSILGDGASSIVSPSPTPFQQPVQGTIKGSLPAGPYVTVSTSSERVLIPRPPEPTNFYDSSTCPHLQSDVVRWHDATTWGNASIPTHGSNVTIPDGLRVLIDQPVTEKLGIITVPTTSELIFGSNTFGVTFVANGFLVLGKLTAGSETCKINTPITITLYGGRPPQATTIPFPTYYKGLVVSGGILSLHGTRFYQTWTRLAKTVNPGDTVLLLQESVNWMAGQQIVLVTSAMKDSRDNNRNEQLTIDSVVSDASQYGLGSIVYVTTPVSYQHIANFNYQVEVGLLSRSIKIQGAADDSEPTDPDPLNCKDLKSTSKLTIYYNTTQPCPNKHLTGFGGHIRIEYGGLGQVEGVELYRMGQTNVMGRYPMHFHLLGNCPRCYFKHSSVHRSYYRCISIHGTNSSTTSENVAYDISGFCYYLEDGIEQFNTITFNLAAYIHTIGAIARADGQKIVPFVQNENLTLPADVAAAGFYISNVKNNVTGNAASGGWAGFAFPVFPTALQSFQNSGYFPAATTGMVIDGNTAHSTGWWWSFGSGFYLGGDLYYNYQGLQEYNAGRSNNITRNTCNTMAQCGGKFCNTCKEADQRWLRITNSKSFLVAGTGMNSWTGRVEMVGYEAHDVRLSLNALSSEGFWLSNSLVVCRTGENLGMRNASFLQGNGIVWYDTGQSHILSNVTFRNCGYRSNAFLQYDTSPTRGCDANTINGCDNDSAVFSSLTQSNQFIPEIMQASVGIKYENCGRRLRFTNDIETGSGRAQNWLDTDGSVSGTGVPTLIGSGINSVKDWWMVDDDVAIDTQGPFKFIKKLAGPQRSLGYFDLEYDIPLQSKVGSVICGTTAIPCPISGFFRHAGKRFSPFVDPTRTRGMPLTPAGEIVGPTGGYGWILTFANKTVPRNINFTAPAIDPSSPMMISIPYPLGTTFQVIAVSNMGCPKFSKTITCNATFTAVPSIDLVRNSKGNTYTVDSTGVLTFRMAQTAISYVGNPTFNLPNYTTPPRDPSELWALQRFERNGVILPQRHALNKYMVIATCPGDTASSTPFYSGYCTNTDTINWSYDPDVCPPGFLQLAYDRCCDMTNVANCIYADGTRNF